MATTFDSGHVSSPYLFIDQLAARARATRSVRAMRSPLIGEHPLQNGLIGRIGHHALVQFLLTFVRFRGQDVTAECVAANHFSGARLLEPFRRTFVSLKLRHRCSLDLFEQERTSKL